MARQGNWNKSYWKKLDKVGKIPEKEIYSIINEELAKTDAVLESKTPIKYGGLYASKYAVITNTPTGVSGKVGYTNTKHWDLDPSDPHQDNITNTELAEILVDKKSVSNDMLDIMDALQDFQDNTKRRITELFKNGGK